MLSDKEHMAAYRTHTKMVFLIEFFFFFFFFYTKKRLEKKQISEINFWFDDDLKIGERIKNERLPNMNTGRYNN